MDKIEQSNGVVSNTRLVVSIQTLRKVRQYYKLMMNLEQINGTGFKHSGSGIYANNEVSRSTFHG